MNTPTETESDNGIIKMNVPAGFVVKIDGIPVQLWNSAVVTTHRGNLGLMPQLTNRTDVTRCSVYEKHPAELPSENPKTTNKSDRPWPHTVLFLLLLVAISLLALMAAFR